MYQRGKIYKIISDNTDEVYIGSTVSKTLAQRMARHRVDHRSYLAGYRGYITSSVLLQHGDARIVLLESFPCNSKDELCAREQHWIDSTENTVNKRRAKGLPIEEYREQNREAIAAKKAIYHQEHKEAVSARNMQYRAQHKDALKTRANANFDCECGGKYTHVHRARHFRTNKHRQWEAAQAEAAQADQEAAQ